MGSVKIIYGYTGLSQELLNEFNKREENAFCYIYEYFYNELFYFTSKLFSASQTDPCDVLQDLFLKIWESEKQFESFEFLKSYLYLSIRNRWKNDLEHQETVQRYLTDQDSDSGDNYILANIIESETLAILYNHLKLLPPECAKVMRLGLQGFKSQEIAETLAISINTVYAQKQKGLAILRGNLTKEMLVFLIHVLICY